MYENRSAKRATAAGVAFVMLLCAWLADDRSATQAQGGAAGTSAAQQLATLKEEGEVVYSRECASCHGADGLGDGAGPALAGDAKLANKDLVLTRILEGAADKGMEPFPQLSDRQVAAVSTFVRNAWDNAHGVVLEADVKPVRDQIKSKKK